MENYSYKGYGFLALGAYGGNQCLPFHKKGYPVLFVNTALEDLESLKEVPDSYKYHIMGGLGCNKDRKKSKRIFRENIDSIVNEIKDRLQGIHTLFIVGSSGGGTSSGVIPSMKRILCADPDMKLTVCIVTVLPSTRNESIKALLNCYETMTEIDTMDEDGATFILDNNKHPNRFRINEMFFSFLDAFITCESNSMQGNIDRAEKQEMFSARGMAYISLLSREKADTGQLISTFRNNVYAPMEQDQVIKYIGLINSGNRIKIEDIYKEVGTPYDKFEGFEAKQTICMLSGLSLPYGKLAEIKAIIDENAATIKRNLEAPAQIKLEGISFFEEAVQQPKKEEKRASNREMLFF